MNSKTTTKQLSWKAKRNGDIYCAPACGAKCKYADFELATKRAEKLAKRLGPGWIPVVHENMGWHYHVKSSCGRIRVSEHWPYPQDLVGQTNELAPEDYTVFLNLDGKIGGRWVTKANTPEVGICCVLDQARSERDAISAMLVGVESILSGQNSEEDWPV